MPSGKGRGTGRPGAGSIPYMATLVPNLGVPDDSLARVAAENTPDGGPARRPDGLIQRVGLVADVVTLALAGGALAVPVIGLLVNQPELGLLVGLAVSVALNCALAVAFARKSAQLRSIAEVVHAQAAQAAKPKATTAPAPRNRWISDHTDPTSLRITNAEFEKAYQGAVELARNRLGSDALVRFLSLEVMEWLGGHVEFDTPNLQFDAHSRNAERAALIICNGLNETPYVNSVWRGQKEPSVVAYAETPWRSDSSWAPLVEASWVRMRPFRGSISITYDQYGWVIGYRRTVDGEDEPEVRFRFNSTGALTEE